MKLLVSSLIVSSLAVLACSQAVRTPEGAEKGQCYGNQTCNSGLICNKSSNICVRDDGSGGSSGSGGNNDTGGSGGSGGNNDTGGSGGNNDTGGASGGSGGNNDTGGASGGSGGSGGSQSGGASGGSGGSGGSNPSGGSSGSGGSSSPGTNACNATAAANAVAFCNGQALGAMTGWGWVALGSADTLTDPTCDTAKAAITAAAPCKTSTNWNKPDALCMTGSIPALKIDDGGAADYTGNWGVQIGVNAKDPNAGMGSSWKTVTLSVTGTPTSGLRAILHKSGDPDTTGYCKEMTTPGAMAITDFNSQCWNSGGTSLTEADAAKIDKVGVQVTSTASAITVSNLCLTKIEFGL